MAPNVSRRAFSFDRILSVASEFFLTLIVLGVVIVRFFLNIFNRILSFGPWSSASDSTGVDKAKTKGWFTLLIERDYGFGRVELQKLRERLKEAELRHEVMLRDLDSASRAYNGTTGGKKKEALSQSAADERDQDPPAYEKEKGSSSIPLDSKEKAASVRMKKQLDAQAKLLEETEGVLEALRREKTDEKNAHLARIATLEERLAKATQAAAGVNGQEKERDVAIAALAQKDRSLVEIQERLYAENQKLDLLRKSQAAQSAELDEARKELERAKESEGQTRERLQAAYAAAQQLKTRLQEAEAQVEQANQASLVKSDQYAQLEKQVRSLEDRDGGHADKASRIVELEESLKAEINKNEEMVNELAIKQDEISRLRDAHNKLKKPRYGQQLTPSSSSSHGRSASISGGRTALERERERTTSNASQLTKNSGSPSSVRFAQLPDFMPVDGDAGERSIGSIGSTKSRDKKRSRQKLSSILGIHMGSTSTAGDE